MTHLNEFFELKINLYGFTVMKQNIVENLENWKTAFYCLIIA